MNHFGFTKEFSNYIVLKEELEKAFNEFQEIINKHKNMELTEI